MGFMVQGVGQIFSQGMTIAIGRADANFLIMVALYMQLDETTHIEFKAELEKYGDLVCECWHNWYHRVSRSNKDNLVQSNVNVPEILRRVLRENNGESSGG